MPSVIITQLPAGANPEKYGELRFSVTDAVNNRPVSGAGIQISGIDNPGNILYSLTTNPQGISDTISLEAPPVGLSLEPGSIQPYSEYIFTIRADGYEPVTINGAEILATITALQSVQMLPLTTAPSGSSELFVIPPHTLYGDYPPPILESETKPIDESGEIVLESVVIPEYVVVHDGPPNSDAENYYVPYRDYIKNVASSEIYATWPESTIYANILAIQSFTLNRIYTEWYPSKGYDFTITSSTAYDHKWIPGRNIFDTINSAVDQIFTNYLSRPGIRQPILTQYCDGKRTTCPDVMSQWGSKDLGERGYSAIEILRYYYGDNMYINTSSIVSGVPYSWPGYTLVTGSSGAPVRTIQEQLNSVSNAYPLIPKLAVDGVFGPLTSEAVRTFQSIFDLPESGTVDFATWYKISQIYVAVTRIAEYS